MFANDSKAMFPSDFRKGMPSMPKVNRFSLIAMDISESTANRSERGAQIAAMFTILDAVEESDGMADIWSFHRKPTRIFDPKSVFEPNEINNVVRTELGIDRSKGKRGTFFAPVFDTIARDPKVRQFSARRPLDIFLLTDGGMDDPVRAVRQSLAAMFRLYPQARLLIIGIDNSMRERWTSIMPPAKVAQIDFSTHDGSVDAIRRHFEG